MGGGEIGAIFNLCTFGGCYLSVVKVYADSIGTHEGWVKGRTERSGEGWFPDTFIEPLNAIGANSRSLELPQVPTAMSDIRAVDGAMLAIAPRPDDDFTQRRQTHSVEQSTSDDLYANFLE